MARRLLSGKIIVLVRLLRCSAGISLHERENEADSPTGGSVVSGGGLCYNTSVRDVDCPNDPRGVWRAMKIIRRLAARNESVRSERPVLIACLGDSVTHGVFDLFVDASDQYIPHHMPDQGYAARLGRKLNELFPVAAVTVLNAGISGDGSAGGLERVERDALSFQPDLVIVNFALNDSMSGEAGLEKYAANMREIFRRILDSGAEALLLTPNLLHIARSSVFLSPPKSRISDPCRQKCRCSCLCFHPRTP
jgi:lysophospholipase L1-like esterase